MPFDEIFREDPWPQADNYSHVLTVGGDGTVLSVAHRVGSEVLVAGLRSSDSSIGYLCGYGHEEAARLVGDLIRGTMKVISVARMKAAVSRLADGGREELSPPILNEVLFSHCHPAGTSRYVIDWQGRREMQRSSGIWISTAIGSTGAMSAAGGKPMPEASTQFQFVVRELFHPADTKLEIGRGVFDPNSSPLVIENRSENSLLAFDGLHGSMPIGFGERVRFLRTEPMQLARP